MNATARSSAVLRSATSSAHQMRVASVEDVLQGKIWVASDPDWRESKRKKDLLDIARIVEAFPEFRDRVPPSLL